MGKQIRHRMNDSILALEEVVSVQWVQKEIWVQFHEGHSVTFTFEGPDKAKAAFEALWEAMGAVSDV